MVSTINNHEVVGTATVLLCDTVKQLSFVKISHRNEDIYCVRKLDQFGTVLVRIIGNKNSYEEGDFYIRTIENTSDQKDNVYLFLKLYKLLEEDLVRGGVKRIQIMVKVPNLEHVLIKRYGYEKGTGGLKNPLKRLVTYPVIKVIEAVARSVHIHPVHKRL